MGLARELPRAGLAEGGAGSRGGHSQQIIEVAAAHQKQAVGRSGAGDRQSAERRVELVQR